MTAALRTLSSLVLLLAALSGAAPAAAQGGPRLFGPTVSQQVMVKPHDLAVEARVVQPDFAAIEALARRHLDVGDFSTFVLDLFDGVELEAEVVHAEVRSTGTTLFGRLFDSEVGSVVLTYEGGVLRGSVSLPGANYVIEQQPDGPYRIARVALPLGRPGHPPIPVFAPSRPEDAFALPDIPGDSGRLVDVLVMWTPAAQAAAGGQMIAIVQSSIDHANHVNLNSGVAHRLRLVHMEVLPYTERSTGCTNPFGGQAGTDVFECALFDITGPADGVVDAVHTLRNTHGADLVAVLIHDQAQTSCGLAWMPTPPSSNTSQFGFSVAAWDCAFDQKAFVHEVGHNYGAQHDPFAGATPPGACGDGFAAGAFCYSRGMVNVAGQWLTAMAYPNQCLAQNPQVFCATLDFFSNPNLTNAGIPLGTAAFNNNAHTLNRTAKAVASYRPTATLLHPIPQRFGDVAFSHPFYGYIEFFGQAEITSGFPGGLFGPDGFVTRTQMAVFLERVKRATLWTPPPAVGLFNDVLMDVFAPWIEALFNDGITSGNGTGGFNPFGNVTRGQMAVFILRAKCGRTYVPNLPAVQRFTDVPPSHLFYNFIDKLAALGITGGCDAVGPRYCPEDPVTRGQMAVFIERAFPFDTPSDVCAL